MYCFQESGDCYAKQNFNLVESKRETCAFHEFYLFLRNVRTGLAGNSRIGKFRLCCICGNWGGMRHIALSKRGSVPGKMFSSSFCRVQRLEKRRQYLPRSGYFREAVLFRQIAPRGAVRTVQTFFLPQTAQTQCCQPGIFNAFFGKTGIFPTMGHFPLLINMQ